MSSSGFVISAGFSLGGMHAWLAAAADKRLFATAAVAGVQGFGWAIDNNSFHVSDGSSSNLTYLLRLGPFH